MATNPSRCARASDVFHRAIALPEADRLSFIARECGDDESLRSEVESLARAHRNATLIGREPTLSRGTRLGAYDIVGFLAAGAMGEIYHARDVRLKRDVAIKILPKSFASDPDRLARFQREAEILAALEHPNIAGIYGLEDTNGTHALVMELVEGETLADRITRGPIALDEALPIAKQIAEALGAAHEQGVIHRDLKPANIKITPDGVVKVLDFGLAKLAHPKTAARADVTASPTITSPAMMTSIGVILGTPTYMAPEQAKGREADKRSDIWAFGAVLYEMLTGKRAFEGEDVSDTLANVLKTEPDWCVLPPVTPAALRALLRSCLTKDRRRRLADISTALFVLEQGAILESPHAAMTAVPLPRRSLWWRVAPTTGVALLVAAIAGAAVWFATRPVTPSTVRTTITTSGSTALTPSGVYRDLTITPDGSRVVYRGNNQLLVRALNQLEPTVLGGLGVPRSPFVSPDGHWIGFFDAFSSLKKVAITGGPPVVVSAVQGNPRGATWGEDGTIIFGMTTTGLQRVSAAGGDPTVLTKPDRERGEVSHSWPAFLPGSNAVLFTITFVDGGIENAQIAVLDLRSGRSKVLIHGGSDAHYVPTGHLIYGIAGTLRAVPFDLARLEVTGTPAPVLDGVMTTFIGATDVAVAANGSLAYIRGPVGGGGQQTVVLVDRHGRASSLPGLPLDAYRDVRVSPDGARLALATQTDVWTYDFARATLSRLTSDPAADRNPLWTPDGRRIIFTSTRAGYSELFWRPADGTGTDVRFFTRGDALVDLFATGWSADGRQLLFTEVPTNIRCAIGQLPVVHPSEAKMLVKGEFCNAHAVVSPDGRWMAYRSRISGRDQIYVERYPELGSRQQISTDGGAMPLWSHDGRELFFGSLDGQQMFGVAMQLGPTMVAGRPQVLFDLTASPPGAGGRTYDLAPEGRFLVIRNVQAEVGGAPAPQIVVVQNWFEELKRVMPVH